VSANDFGGAVTLDPFRAVVPVPDDAMKIQRENGVVGDTFDQQLVPLFALPVARLGGPLRAAWSWLEQTT
jgi:hypothetical protein